MKLSKQANEKNRDKQTNSGWNHQRLTRKSKTMARLREQYKETILPELKTKFGRENILSLPRMEKIVINMGVGSATQDKKELADANAAMTLIAGQKPVITKARKSIANFRLREGQAIGCKVTLRGDRMFEFMDRLFSLGATSSS